MVAHNVRHTVICPAFGNGQLAKCICGQVMESERDPKRNVKAIVESAERTRERVLAVQRAAWIAVRGALGRTQEQIAGDLTLPGLTIARCDGEVLAYVGDAISMMSMRIVRVARPADWDCVGELKLVVHQCCPVCRESYQTAIAQGEEASPMRLVSMVGDEARRARMRHRCHPISREAAAVMDYEDLATIAAELERDGTAMVTRSQELSKIADERAAKAAIASATPDETEKGISPQ